MAGPSKQHADMQTCRPVSANECIMPPSCTCCFRLCQQPEVWNAICSTPYSDWLLRQGQRYSPYQASQTTVSLQLYWMLACDSQRTARGLGSQQVTLCTCSVTTTPHPLPAVLCFVMKATSVAARMLSLQA